MAHEYITWAYAQEIEQPLAKFVLVCLADAADSSGRSFPGQKRLSDMTGMSIRTLRRHLERLEADGYLRREERRRKDGTRTSDEYQLPHKISSGQIGPLFTTGQSGRMSSRVSKPVQNGKNPPPSTGQPDPLSASRSTGQFVQGQRTNWPVDTKPTSDPSSTAQTPAYQAAKLTGHEPLTTREPITTPPHPPPEPPRETEGARGQPQAVEESKNEESVSLPPEVYEQLDAFRKLHGPKATPQMFRAWARSVRQDLEAHGEERVLFALEKTNGNFAELKFPFSFYRACLTRKPSASGELADADDFKNPVDAADLLDARRL